MLSFRSHILSLSRRQSPSVNSSLLRSQKGSQTISNASRLSPFSLNQWNRYFYATKHHRSQDPSMTNDKETIVKNKSMDDFEAQLNEQFSEDMDLIEPVELTEPSIDLERLLKERKLSLNSIEELNESSDVVREQLAAILEKDYSNDPYMFGIQRLLKEEKERWEERMKEYVKWYDMLVEAHEQHDTPKVEFAYMKLLETEILEDPSIFLIVILHHAQNDNYVKVASTYERAKDLGQCNREIFHHVISFYLSKRNIAKAVDIFRDMAMVIEDYKEEDMDEYIKILYPALGSIALKAPKIEALNVVHQMLKIISPNSSMQEAESMWNAIKEDDFFKGQQQETDI